jgi:Xaa-Pro aminopeptidase
MPNVFSERRKRLFEELPDSVRAVVLPSSNPLFYVSGIPMTPLERHGSERVFVLVLTRGAEPAVVRPEGELLRVPDEIDDDNAYTYDYVGIDDPMTPAVSAFRRLCRDLDIEGDIGVEYRYTRLLEYVLLADEFSWEDVVDVSDTFGDLRQQKDETEIAALRRSGEIIDECLGQTLRTIEPGMTEAEVEADLKRRILGSEADGWGVTLALAGTRTAELMEDASDYRIQKGDLVLIDTGAIYDGYYTDVSRTIAVGEPDPDIQRMYEAVRAANEAALDVVEQGTELREIELAAREVLDNAGYLELFERNSGRVGHGIGLDGHEPPYVGPENESPLEVGNVITVEPGLYSKGLGGIRIEDDIAITDDGPELLTNLSRDLHLS